LEERTKRFALRVIRLVARSARNRAADALGHQLLKAGASIGATYQESNPAESGSKFVRKSAIVEKEAAEAQYRS
jgi:four helix bundle protein